MTTAEIKELLNGFIGQKYNTYDYFDIANKVMALFPKDIYDKVTYEHERGTLTFIYKYGAGRYEYNSIMTVVIKKRKGETHRSWYGNSTDYYVKDFEINYLGTTDFEGAVRYVRNCIKSRNENNDKNYELIKSVLEITGLSFDEFRNLTRYTEKDWYEISQKLKAENN